MLCAPSLQGESFGMVLLEGMAAGCAVVASDIEGYRMAAGGHATLVPPGDAVALAAALDTAVAEAGTDESSAEARKEATEYARAWSMDSLAERYRRRLRAGDRGLPRRTVIGPGRSGGPGW